MCVVGAMNDSCCYSRDRCYRYARKWNANCKQCHQSAEPGVVKGLCAACFADALGEDFCPCPGSKEFRVQHVQSRPLPIIVHDLSSEVLLSAHIHSSDEFGDLLAQLRKTHHLDGRQLAFGHKIIRGGTRLMDVRRMFEITAMDVMHVQAVPRPPGLSSDALPEHRP